MKAPTAPLPPLDLDQRQPALHILKRGASLHRFFNKRYHPIHFDRSANGRFNAPGGEFGVLYVAEQRTGAFAETFLRMPGRTQIPLDLLAAKAYVRLELARAVKLALLSGPGLARVGATAEVCHRSRPYRVPQAWSKALHDHAAKLDGIAYTARHDDQTLCIALFDRAANAMREAEHIVDLDQDWFWELAEPYGIGIPPA